MVIFGDIWWSMKATDDDDVPTVYAFPGNECRLFLLRCMVFACAMAVLVLMDRAPMVIRRSVSP